MMSTAVPILKKTNNI